MHLQHANQCQVLWGIQRLVNYRLLPKGLYRRAVHASNPDVRENVVSAIRQI